MIFYGISIMENVPAGSERTRLEQELPPEIERRLVLRLLGYWRALCGERRMPSFSDIDPTAIPDIWPHSFVLETDETGGSPIFRALGAEVDSPSAGSLVGKRLTDAPAEGLPGLALAYVDEVFEKGVPVSRGGEFCKPDGTRVLYRSILLPIADDGDTISGILGAANCRELVEI